MLVGTPTDKEPPMTATVTALPTPSKKHATCAWCRRDFERIVDLIDHVDIGHLEPADDRHADREAA